MTDTTKPADLQLAVRILKAAGIEPAAIAATATTQLQRLEAKDKQDAEDGAVPITDPKQLWSHHSAKTLHRYFAGRCLTCVFWGIPNTRDCLPLPKYLGGKSAAPTEPTFGCNLYEEIPVEDEKTITTRTELAFALGLLSPYPGTDEAIEVKPVEAGTIKAETAKTAKTAKKTNG